MSVFRFKQFDVKQTQNPLKVGTDSMLLGAFIDANYKRFGLDLGSGTGVLSLMIAQKNTEIQIDAIEINPLAAEECSFNFEQSVWNNRLKCIEGDYLKLDFQKSYDLIFSNPPYHLEEVLNDNNEITRAKHSSSNELVELFCLVNRILSEDGDFWVILPFQMQTYIQKIAAENHLFCKQLIQIHAKSNKPNTRTIFRFSKNSGLLSQRDFFIRNEDNSYTSEYIELTKEFHFVEL
ncbi:MAG: methyltransferase [Flavobacteriales bacterium]|nr:methyltransferase [Flavobacteriales bacterium]